MADDFIPEMGEPVWTTDTFELFVGDGTTPGGRPAVANSNAGTLTQTKQQGTVTVGADTNYMTTAFDASIMSLSPHHLLVNDGLLLIETIDYTINMARTQVMLTEDVRAAIAARADIMGADLQLINFVTTLA